MIPPTLPRDLLLQHLTRNWDRAEWVHNRQALSQGAMAALTEDRAESFLDYHEETVWLQLARRIRGRLIVGYHAEWSLDRVDAAVPSTEPLRRGEIWPRVQHELQAYSPGSGRPFTMYVYTIRVRTLPAYDLEIPQ